MTETQTYGSRHEAIMSEIVARFEGDETAWTDCDLDAIANEALGDEEDGCPFPIESEEALSNN